MPQAPAFSRLQLAAALLEYDNDPTNPLRRAQDSAIFAHFRRNPAAPPQLSSRRSDYLGVSLPSEAGSHGGRESAMDNRRSRASRGSLDALRNPFGPDDHWSEEGEGDEEELEVDLASWGLDTLIPKDKGKSTKGKAKAATLPLHPVSSVRSHIPLTNNGNPTAAPRRAINTSRSVSLGDIAEHPGILLEAGNKRRRSFGSPLDLVDMEISQLPLQRPRSLSYSATQPLSSTSQSVPFPSSSARSPSPGAVRGAHGHQVSGSSHFVDRRTLSYVSTGSEVLLQDDRTRRMSSGTAEPVAADNLFAIRPPSPSRLSRFDPKATAHTRTFSNVSRGSMILPDKDNIHIDNQDQPRRERKYSTTLDLLRPKILVMPSPLQPIAPEAPSPQSQARDGFLLSTDGPPLPPGARSTRRNSVLEASNNPPIASNSFIPNPLMNLSLSQMTFRNTLHIGGQRDPYSEIVGELPRATQDGEQVQFDTPDVKVNENDPLPSGGLTSATLEHRRPPGKLFGKSLIDDLELRKAQMRSKQRVFTGDQRPSMMSREQTRSTFIDPLTLNSRPNIQHQNSFGIPNSKQALSRGNSLSTKPLLNFDDEEAKFKPSTSTTRMASGRSVFGVDTLWEREMAKLREIEAQEGKAAEEQTKRIEQEKPKGKKKKGKKKGQQELNIEVPRVDDAEPRVSFEPPVLPDIRRATRPPPKIADEESDDDHRSDDDIEPTANTKANDDTGQWFSDSDGEGPRRTTGIGPRYPNKVRHLSKPEDGDSEEDLPLSAAVTRAVQRATRQQLGDDSDEEKPLSFLLQKTKPVRFDNLASGHDLEDDDDKPLGLRASGMANRPTQARDDDDNRPLAFHPQQQRRTQYQMMAQQQQQQQQQLMMQAQFQNSMFFSPPTILGSGFFGPPIVSPAMMVPPPIPVPSPPPIQDAAKFGRVDKWRHDVAVEGSH